MTSRPETLAPPVVLMLIVGRQDLQPVDPDAPALHPLTPHPATTTSRSSASPSTASPGHAPTGLPHASTS
ncbi:MAG: hypothetical protein EBT09_05700 [Actinobacteria bacterium]|nr:hypothetical protein [Actinomycetota bacterium]